MLIYVTPLTRVIFPYTAPSCSVDYTIVSSPSAVSAILDRCMGRLFFTIIALIYGTLYRFNLIWSSNSSRVEVMGWGRGIIKIWIVFYQNLSPSHGHWGIMSHDETPEKQVFKRHRSSDFVENIPLNKVKGTRGYWSGSPFSHSWPCGQWRHYGHAVIGPIPVESAAEWQVIDPPCRGEGVHNEVPVDAKCCHGTHWRYDGMCGW